MATENKAYTLEELEQLSRQTVTVPERPAPTIEDLDPQYQGTSLVPEPSTEPSGYPEKGWGVGVSETIVALGAGAMVTPVAGFVGLYDLLSGKTEEEAADTIASIQRKYIPMPDSKEGQQFLNAVSTPGELLTEAGDWVGNWVFDNDTTSEASARASRATEAKIFVEFGSPAIVAKLTMGVLPRGWNEVKGAYNTITSAETREAAIRRSAAEQLKITTGDDLSWIVDAKNKYDAISETGVQPPIGTTVNKQTLIDRQTQIDSFSASTINFAEARRKENVKKLNEFAKKTFASTPQEYKAILGAAKGDINKVVAGFDDKRRKLLDNQVKIIENLKKRNVRPEDIGKTLTKIAEQEFRAAKDASSAKFASLGNPTLDGTSLRASLDVLVRGDHVPESVMDLYKAIQAEEYVTSVGGQKYAKGASTIKFDDLKGHLENIGADYAQMKTGIANATDFSKINKMKRVATEALAQANKTMDLLEQSGNSQLITAYREAKAYHKKNVVDRFYVGGGKTTTHANSFGRRKVVDEKVIDEFFTRANKTSGGTRSVQDFIKVYGNDARAWDQLEIAVSQKYASAAISTNKDGQPVYSRAKAMEWLENHNSLFEAHPALKRMQRSLVAKDDALWRISATMNKVNKNKTETQMQALADKIDTDDLSGTVDRALRDPRLMDRLVKSTNDSPAARLGRSRMIGDHLMAKALDYDTKEIHTKKLVKYLEENEGALRKGMAPNHYDALKTIYTAAKDIEAHVIPSKKRQSSPAEALREELGVTWNMVVASFRNAWRGRTSYVQEGALLGGLVVSRLSQKQAIALQQHAFYDPPVAAELAALLKAPSGSKAAQYAANNVSRRVIELGLVETSAMQDQLREDRENINERR